MVVLLTSISLTESSTEVSPTMKVALVRAVVVTSLLTTAGAVRVPFTKV